MPKKIDFTYMHDLHRRFKKLSPGQRIEIEIDRLGAEKGRWEIPMEFRELFEKKSIRIESAEIVNRSEGEKKYTWIMYNWGGDPGVTFIY